MKEKREIEIGENLTFILLLLMAVLVFSMPFHCN
jgi:hypothetical protein